MGLGFGRGGGVGGLIAPGFPGNGGKVHAPPQLDCNKWLIFIQFLGFRWKKCHVRPSNRIRSLLESLSLLIQPNLFGLN
jgi:hypothetical protein